MGIKMFQSNTSIAKQRLALQPPKKKILVDQMVSHLTTWAAGPESVAWNRCQAGYRQPSSHADWLQDRNQTAPLGQPRL
ncbi:unnamed protein product [Urochloa humidicola]